MRENVKNLVKEIGTSSRTEFDNMPFSSYYLQVGGPYWEVPLGRKDSITANYALANTNIPTADEGLLSLISKFIYQGLSVTDVVALSGTGQYRILEQLCYQLHLLCDLLTLTSM